MKSVLHHMKVGKEKKRNKTKLQFHVPTMVDKSKVAIWSVWAKINTSN